MSALLPAAYRDEVIADLVEERDAMRHAGRGAVSTAAWLAWHVILSAVASRRRFGVGDTPGHPPRRLRFLGGPGFGRELRQAARSLRRTPWYAATIIAVVALSMALATTVFAIVDGVLFRPLPYPDADELYAVGGVIGPEAERPERGIEYLSEKEITAWSADAPGVLLTGLAYYVPLYAPDLTTISAVGVDPRFFDVFRVRLRLGGFTDEQLRPVPRSERPGGLVPAIISDRVWQAHFDGDPAVLGRVVRADAFLATPYVVVGVLEPAGFVPPVPTATGWLQIDALVPWLNGPEFGERGLVAFARVPDGRLPETRTALNRAAARYAANQPPRPANASPRSAPYQAADLQPLGDYLTRRNRVLFIIAFGTAIGLVAIVPLNTGALAAARATYRVREFSLRRALGARPLDLLLQALAEQAVLAVPGTLVGLSFSALLLPSAVGLLPPGLNLMKDVGVDWRVAAFAALVTCTTSFLVALLPMKVALDRRQLATGLVGLSESSPTRHGPGRILIAGQVALAFVLILGSAFFITSLARVWNEDPGFRTHDAAMLLVGLKHDRVPRAVGPEVVAALRQVPGVEQATIFQAPLLQQQFGGSSLRLPDADAPPEDRPTSFEIGSGFFEALDIRALEGRLPSDAELDGQAPVLVVSESAARTYWPDRPAVGQTLVDRRRSSFTVVGVVPDVRWAAPDVAPAGAIYSPWAQGRTFLIGFELLVTFQGETDATLAASLARIRRFDRDVWVAEARTVEEALVDTVRARRLSALTATIFAGTALLFTAIGLLGLVTMTVGHRTREVGIRMALGARPGGVVRQLVGEPLVAVTVGLVAGAGIALWAVGFIEAQLYQTAAHDPAVWFVSAVVMLATAGVGACIPALRASRIDPVRALREG